MKQFYILSGEGLSRLAKKNYLSFLFVLLTSTCFGQTTNISGVVNTYHKVIQVIPAKACLRVANATGLNVNTMVMVVQMKGATMNTTSSSNAFGDTTSLNGAGNYEIGTICYIIGDSVFLFHQLLNTYDSSAKVQLVQFAEYYSANVIDTVKAASWDSATGLGGVIAIYAEEDLTLNKPIYADSSGNSGGAYYPNNATCGFLTPVGTDYAYDITAANQNNGAYKGESVANISAAQNSAKGAPANGGGGGNNHNNSGGGGANLTAGGAGGGNSSGTPFGCATLNNYGRAGKALKSWNGTKIFMGGGAGAGHANNGTINFNYGGNGGGIIFIWANNLIGNGHAISANGGRGGDSQADGAGGGGAGGTIIMNVNNYTGSATIAVNGGNGGDSYDDPSIVRCFGGGGGGSGGVVYFKAATPGVTVAIAAGTGGQEFNRNAGCGAAVPGATGTAGSIIANYSFSRSTNPAGYCHLLLPSKLLYFNAHVSGNSVVLSWQVDHPELVNKFVVEKRTENNGWADLNETTATDTRFKYASTDVHASVGYNFYRLKIIDNDGATYYSDIRKIWLSSRTTDLFIYPNPASGKILVTGKLQTGENIRVTDMSGRVIYEKKIVTRPATVLLPPLPPGVYLVQHNGMAQKLFIR
jgi:hypothetical protein